VKENPRMHIPIFGNGDIDSPEKALLYKNRYGIDGIMIGRAAIGYPWIFDEIKHFFKTGEHLPPPTIQARVEAARQHLQRAIEWKGERLGVMETRKHYTNYFKGLEGIKEFRKQLVVLDAPADVFGLLDEMLENYAVVE
jgi:tRNA-dihydrouridine synthase